MDHTKYVPTQPKRKSKKQQYYEKPEDDDVEQWIEPEGMVNNASELGDSKAQYNYSTKKKPALINNYTFRREVESDPHIFRKEEEKRAQFQNSAKGVLLPDRPKLVGKGQGLGYEEGNYLGFHPIDRPYVYNIDDVRGRPILPLEIEQHTPKAGHAHSCSGVVKLMRPRKISYIAPEKPVSVGDVTKPVKQEFHAANKKGKSETFVGAQVSDKQQGAEMGKSTQIKKAPQEGLRPVQASTVLGRADQGKSFSQRNKMGFPGDTRAAVVAPVVVAPMEGSQHIKKKQLSAPNHGQVVGTHVKQTTNGKEIRPRKNAILSSDSGAKVAPIGSAANDGKVYLKQKKVKSEFTPLQQGVGYRNQQHGEFVGGMRDYDGGETDPIIDYRY